MTATVRHLPPSVTHHSPANAARPGYIRLADRRLVVTLATEDRAEVDQGLSPHERITCRWHRRWAHDCIASPQHVIAVTGHRWCDPCAAALTVAVDELTGRVELSCPRCHRTPHTRAAAQIIRSCEASLRAARRNERIGHAGPVHPPFALPRTA